MEHVKRGKLKLKNASTLKVSSKKHKTKRKKEKKQVREELGEEKPQDEDVEVVVSDLTPAQRRHEEHRRKREEEEIEKVASKTYRQRVEELNQYLGTLTEHHDIPRVSAAGNG